MAHGEHWLTGQEQREVCERLLHFGLIEWSNARDLLLKSGVSTDLFIKLRDARNSREAIEFISWLFENPLRRQRPDRFVEIPDAVSCFAGPLLLSTGIPYLTIREHPKEGRVAQAKVIGEVKRGDRVCIIDDVITNGDSKITPYRECIAMGLDVLSLIVLVDRQQGWRETFARENIPLAVWSGMTLHDVRKYLITEGIMEHCEKSLEEKNPLIVALDGKDWEEILPLIERLRTTGCILKVNDLLFYEGFRGLIPDLEVYGRVMADLKGHDIPNTIENICTRLLHNPPWAVTVHGSGGKKMIQAAVKIFRGTKTKVLVVTLLTSIDEETCEEIYTRMPIEQVRALAEIADRAGAHGLVCSPEEVAELRGTYPNMTLVNPGVRSPGTEQGDQKRIGTPRSALERGANYLVMGRQILDAPDPHAEVMRLLTEELDVL